MSKTIELSKGKVAIVDNADYEWLNKVVWHYAPGTRTGYASTSIQLEKGKRTTALMHRLIMGDECKEKGSRVLHANLDGLDNRRCNLYVQARGASHEAPKVLAEYEGISYRKGGPWVAEVMAHGVPHYLGNFATAEAANRARMEALSGNIAE